MVPISGLNEATKTLCSAFVRMAGYALNFNGIRHMKKQANHLGHRFGFSVHRTETYKILWGTTKNMVRTKYIEPFPYHTCNCGCVHVMLATILYGFE